LCPSCDAKRAHIFAENVHQNILPKNPIHHVVWTMPKRIRPYFQRNRTLRGLLFQAGWQSWKEYTEWCYPELAGEQAKTGAVMSLHALGSLLNTHPHLHSMILGGLVDTDGRFYQLPQIDTSWLEQRFREKLLTALLKSTAIEPEVVDSMQSWQHSGFNVHVGEQIDPDEDDSRLFIARYLLKCPIALSKIELLEEPLQTTVRYHKETDDQCEYRDFSPLEFLAAISQAIPGTWEQLVRYYGVCSPRTRGAANRDMLVLKSLPAEEINSGREENQLLALPTERKPVSRQWAIWIKNIYEYDPLECPKCNGRMKIKAFIHNPAEIKRICQHLGIQAWQAPRPIRPP